MDKWKGREYIKSNITKLSRNATQPKPKGKFLDNEIRINWFLISTFQFFVYKRILSPNSTKNEQSCLTASMARNSHILHIFPRKWKWDLSITNLTLYMDILANKSLISSRVSSLSYKTSYWSIPMKTWRYACCPSKMVSLNEHTKFFNMSMHLIWCSCPRQQRLEEEDPICTHPD